jgi:SAM-dependent methyltransferase
MSKAQPQTVEKRKEDPESSAGLTVSEQRKHKRRQRKRNQERKQNALNELMERIISLENKEGEPISVASVRDLYSPIPSIGDENELFWQKVPQICNPCTAVLDSTIADNSKLARDKQNQGKYQKKLETKLQLGEITESERKELWNKHGRYASDSKGVSLLSSDRGQRKAWQIENFAFLLKHKLTERSSKEKLTVVDFGCGSGNLCLALAAYFDTVRFVLVDRNPYPLKLAARRAREAGLNNVEVMQYTFSPNNLSDFRPCISTRSSAEPTKEGKKTSRSFDIGIGLHSCGSFTDMVMEICFEQGANCIVCPCCNGAMTAEKTCGYQYPRSSFFQKHMSQDEYLGQLSRSADDLGNYEAKCLIEYDRAMWAKEKGFKQVDMWRLNPAESTPKHHVLYLQH